MLRDSQSKVVVALLKLAQQLLGVGGRADGPILLSVSPMDLSARVGLDVDSVKRIVQELRNAGYLRITDERVEVPDPEALRELYGLLGVKDQILGGDSHEPTARTRPRR